MGVCEGRICAAVLVRVASIQVVASFVFETFVAGYAAGVVGGEGGGVTGENVVGGGFVDVVVALVWGASDGDGDDSGPQAEQHEAELRGRHSYPHRLKASNEAEWRR